MKRLAFLILTTALCACQPTLLADRITLIENTTAIDAINGARSNVNILILDDKIETISKAGQTFKLEGAVTRIDGAGKYVIPGLWDAHVHLSYNDDIGHEVFFPLAIAHGVTSLRDTGGHLDKLAEARKLSAENPKLPDLYVSGPLLDGERRVYDGSPGFPDISVGFTTEKEAADYVDQLTAQGVSFVKAYEMLPPNIFAAIDKQAEKNGLKTAMHIPLAMTAEEAVAAGADDMQHLRNIEMSCAGNAPELLHLRNKEITENLNILPSKLRSNIHSHQRALALSNQSEERCQALMNLLAREDVFQTPTLTISRFFTRRLFEDAEFKTTFDYMPGPIATAWSERSARLRERSAGDADIAYDQWIIGTIPKLAKADVPIMAGTDAPIAFLTPGASLHEELILLTDAGLTPLESLRAATYEPARFLGLETSQGTIADGMKADLVILDANPLDNIKNIKLIEIVIKSGFVIDREELDALLAKPSAIAKP